MLLLLLSVALAGAVAGAPLGWSGVGLPPLLLVIGYLLMLRAVPGGKDLPRWKATNLPESDDGPLSTSNSYQGTSDGRLYSYVGLAAAVIFAAGWVVAQTGDALAGQTGLGSSFVGVALVAASTSLPELSTTLAAVRRGRHEMAVSGILGTNCLEVALLFLADVTYRESPILATADQSALVAASMGLVVTSIYLLGLLERRDGTVARLGWDSLAVLCSYIAGLLALYHVR
jgi:cation:H+ antiporter